MTAPPHTPLRLRFILNTFYSGPQAWFFLADDRGYFRDEGLEVEFTEGDTLANAVPKLMSGDYDAGYGDMNALVEWASARPQDAPVAVFAMHNRSPYTIAVPAASAVRNGSDLAGRTLVTHPNDAAWRMFPEFCAACGIDPASVKIEESALPHREIVPLMLQGRWEGLFGFVNTINAQTIEAGLDPKTMLRHFEWQHHVPSLYGAAVMVTPALRRDHPQAVAGLVRAVNRGVADTVADIEAAVDAVVRRNPAIDRVANRARLAGTLALEMAHGEGATLGIGAVDMARLAQTTALMSRAKQLAHPPAPDDLFDGSFLPPVEARVRSLATNA
ncbi:ABC transporter substrate-binding protein [Variovorax sp. J22R133]|uniref:ABC transporter substrate-binding protein n=1 Tax=Variovorax brevis TaxID=3053503 RepID=UPI002578D141|nr:ABC transporter substrate-binding protein [Variovorax sp. J22R133]MDM0111314.1 ABC transporter substrate-binding protein [Variovorax sp. J22R133]